MRSTIISLLALSSMIVAAPFDTLHKRTQASLLAIAPTSNTCANAPAAGECATAAQAAPAINKSFKTYNITTDGEAAALVSLMAFETGDFKFDHNHFPGRPGQGTRNMQMAPVNAKYAASIPAIKDKAAAAGSDVNAVLKLLTADIDYDFGSAAWYYSTQCSPDVKKGLQSGSADGWNAYITSCVQTTVDDKRKDYYNRAAKAFGLPGH